MLCPRGDTLHTHTAPWPDDDSLLTERVARGPGKPRMRRGRRLRSGSRDFGGGLAEELAQHASDALHHAVTEGGGCGEDLAHLGERSSDRPGQEPCGGEWRT